MDIDVHNKISSIDTRLSILERSFSRLETENSIKLTEIKVGNDKLEEKLDALFNQTHFVKGFIRAVVVAGSLATVAITVVIKYIH